MEVGELIEWDPDEAGLVVVWVVRDGVIGFIEELAIEHEFNGVDSGVAFGEGVVFADVVADVAERFDGYVRADFFEAFALQSVGEGFAVFLSAAG